MSFLNPIFLVGLLSAAIPLIIHLSRSRRTKKIRFSTTRFLTDKFLRSYRMSRLKEWLLLAARMALCALFAMALAQPFLRSGGQSILAGRQSRTVVIVVDNSASMAYRENDVTLLDRARKAAVEIVDGLKEGGRASIVLAGRRHHAVGPEVLFDKPTPELGDVRQTIDTLQVAELGTDLSQAVVRAEQIVQSGSTNTSREIYILSDLQDSGWEMLGEDDPGPSQADVNMFFVSVRPKQVKNLAVTAVQYAASRPMVGIPFSIRPHIRNHNSGAVGCDVELYVDGKKVGERRIETIQAGRWSVPTLHHTFDTGGWHTGYVQVKDETLHTDNRRYFAFEVLDGVKVVAVNGASSSVKRLDELFFLEAALRASASSKSPIDVSVVLPRTFAGTDLTGIPLVILANVESLPPQAVDKLESFVDQGGSLLVFLGDKVNASFYNQTLTGTNRMHGGLLPGRLARVEGNPTAEVHSANVGDIDGNHVVLASFAEGDGGDLQAVTLKALWDFDVGNATVLMRTNSGAPLLVERQFGKGQVMLFASTCDRDWTNFPVRPSFLPWIYRLVGYLSQEPIARQNFHNTGDLIPVAVSATEGLPQLLVKKPDGSIGNVGSTGDPSVPMGFDDTQQTGAYTMYAPGKEAEAQVFVANLEAFESDLTFLDDVLGDSTGGEKTSSRNAKIENGIKEVLLPGRPLVTFVEDPAHLSEAAMGAGQGIRLWDMLLFLALAVALFEPWFANRISLRHYLKPREIAKTPLMPTGRLRMGALLNDGKETAQQEEAKSIPQTTT